jgi:pyruvate kinase
MSIVTELDLLKHRRTKIVATIGPASSSPAVIAELIEAGVNVFRVNFSHGTHAAHGAEIATIREVAQRLDTPTAILADLCGPKIRTGRFHGGTAEIATGSDVVVTRGDALGNATTIPSQYPALATDVQVGHRILLNDGAVELRVDAIRGADIECTVVAGGTVGDHKGINLPGSKVSAPSLTDKDRADAEFALAAGVDFLALSFVRSARDIDTLRQIVDTRGSHAGIIAKIEKPDALANGEAIIEAADGIMVARGDLGVELNPEQVPLAQAQLIERARARNKPVIVATQMLESMIENARPTRAEVSDVSFAVASGADAIMLSGESAVGRYPVAAVRMMDRVARQTESWRWHAGTAFSDGARQLTQAGFGEAIASATARLVGDLRAAGVLVISARGRTAGTISAARPAAPVVAISNDRATCRRMSLLWGIVPQWVESAGSENPNQIARRVARDLGLAEGGGYVVLVRGFHADRTLNSPSITVLEV